MTASHTAARPAAAFRHPVFWGALGLLLLNDHWLKGADLLPGAVTGKLSDFAGLLVAPIVLAGLLGVRSKRGVALAMVATGAVFSAINLSPACAAAMEGVMSFMSWRIYPDPSDLVALPALLGAWALTVEVEDRRETKRALTVAALALGAFACMATSEDTTGEECSVDSDCDYTVTDDALLCCDATCVDMAYDEQNCGGCGVVCGDGMECRIGRCAATGQGLTAHAGEITVLDVGVVRPSFSLQPTDRSIELRPGRVVVSNGGRSVETLAASPLSDPASLDCDALRADPEAALAGAAFDEATHLELDSFGRVALDARAECDAVLVTHPVAGSAIVVLSEDAALSLVRLVGSSRWVETEGADVLVAR